MDVQKTDYVISGILIIFKRRKKGLNNLYPQTIPLLSGKQALVIAYMLIYLP